jgi:hypothetical protein
VTQERDWNEPPKGASPEDAALWHRLRDTLNDAVLTMARVTQCAYRIRYGQYYEAIEAYEKVDARDGARAERAKAARAQLEKAAREADEAIPKQGLRVRVCRYTLRDFDQRIDAQARGDDARMAGELPRFRGEAKGCADEIGAFAARLHPKADALEVALVAVDAAVERETPKVPDASSAAAAPAKGTP